MFRNHSATNGESASERPEARRRKQLLRWAAGVIAVAILLPVLLIGIAATLLPADLVGRAAAVRAEAALGVPVAIDELEVDFWPVPSVSLRQTRVGAEGEPVALVDRILLRPRLLPLLTGRVTVREVAIDRPDIRLIVDSTGALNLPFSSGEQQEPADTEIDFEIDVFRIRDGRLRFTDQRDGTEVVLNALQQTLRVDGRVEEGSLARVGLGGRLSSDSVDATLPARLAAPLEGVSFALEHEAELDRSQDRLTISNLRLELQRLALAGRGRIEGVSDSLTRTAALELSADEFGFEDLANSLPDGFLAALLGGRDGVASDSGSATGSPRPDLEYGGRAAIRATIVGPITRDSMPRIEGSVRLRDAAITRGGASILSHTGGTIAFSNEEVVSPDVAGALFGAPFTLSFRVEDLAEPVTSFATRGTARLEELIALLQREEPLRASGNLPFDLRGQIAPADLRASRVEGSIGLGGVRLQEESLLQPVEVSSGSVRFAGGALRIEDLALSFGESRVRVAASVDRWLAAALGDTVTLAEVGFDAEAATLDLDALLGPSESEYAPLLFARLADQPVNGRSASEAAAELGLALPDLPRLQARGELRAARLVRNGIAYEDLEVALESSPTAVSAPRVRFGLMGGTVDLGLALERVSDEATLIAVYHLENVGAGTFFSRFTTFEGRLSGILSLDGEASLQLDSLMLPVRPTVHSTGRMALTAGSLSGWPLLTAVGQRLGLESFDTLAFRDWSGDYRVTGPLVSLDRAVQVSDGVETELAGSFDFAGKLDLAVVARLSPELVVAASPEIRSAATSLAGERGSVPIGLRIAGTARDPSITLDLTAARDEALSRARDRATEEGESAARRAASEVARRALGDSVQVEPEDIGEAVRERVQDRIRGLFGRPAPAAGAPGQSPAQGATEPPRADSITATSDTAVSER